jgi:Fe2+ transport system protein B
VNKYYNRHVRTSDGIIHDSQREANRWIELKLLERAGQIKNLNRQVKFILIPKQVEYIGKKVKVLEREVSYIADFVYQENGQTVVEDTKGMRTRDYIIKRKLMLYIHGIKIREV